jgi:hypothetical protein
MTETRKIAAILVADVVGYSRLAGADEKRTLARPRPLRCDLIERQRLEAFGEPLYPNWTAMGVDWLAGSDFRNQGHRSGCSIRLIAAVTEQLRRSSFCLGTNSFDRSFRRNISVRSEFAVGGASNIPAFNREMI